jgi:exopolysaccharide biosynthesis protein
VKHVFNKPLWWAITFSFLLTGSTVLVLLDTFVIPKTIQVVQSASNIQNSDPVFDSNIVASSNPVEKAAGDGGAASAIVSTADIYQDDNIKISITIQRVNNTQVYIADIQLGSIDHLKTAFAQDTFGRNISQTTSSMADAHGAILAINGDYCGFRDYGLVIRNGVVYRDTSKSTKGDQALVIYRDGSFETVTETAASAEALIKKGAVQAFSFGPTLLNNGEMVVNQTSEVSRAQTSNPRTAIGIISPLHYVFIVSDGRTKASTGLSLYELASVFKECSCLTAYNLDGGGSTAMYFNGKIINVPSDGMKLGERKVSDIVYIGY